jgi:HEAT repeat protein
VGLFNDRIKSYRQIGARGDVFPLVELLPLPGGREMNNDFQRLSRQLVEEEIDTSQFLAEVRALGNHVDDLLAAMKERRDLEDWKNLGRLMWAVSLMPDRRFTPLLCELLDNHRYDAYMEALADSLVEIGDERSVPCIIRALDYCVYGDDGRHFNRALLNALFKIGTKDALEGIRQAQGSSDDLIKSHAEEFLSRI